MQTQRREMRGLDGDVCYRQTLSHEYDESGLTRTLSIDTHEPIRFTHDLASRLSGIEFAPGLDHAFSYDSAGRLAQQTARRAGHRETHIGYMNMTSVETWSLAAIAGWEWIAIDTIRSEESSRIRIRGSGCAGMCMTRKGIGSRRCVRPSRAVSGTIRTARAGGWMRRGS
ncbi:hypothetical protein [Caballeronia sp. LZ034LL]|uniref:hypothetical protein n=1 Tax=Caballeronia sp. LZ034LL TaxID=3038567 RepID=UPI0038571B52